MKPNDNNRSSNIEYIYMPFVRRGKVDQNLTVIHDIEKRRHWQEINYEDASEQLYLHSYISGFRIGQESDAGGKKYRHFVFVGENDGAKGAFLNQLTSVLNYAADDKSTTLFSVNRTLTAGGPICDNGSLKLRGNNLGMMLFGKDFDVAPEKTTSSASSTESPEERLNKLAKSCDCWRICKAHRFPNGEPEEGRLFEESSQGKSRRFFTISIRQVHCYLFITGIAILAFEIEFQIPSWLKTSESYFVSSGMFHLKKVHSTRIIACCSQQVPDSVSYENGGDDDSKIEGVTLANLGKLLASDLLGISPHEARGDNDDTGRPYLFYYIPAMEYKEKQELKSMRANSLVYVAEKSREQSPTETEKKQLEINAKLYYLANCFDINLPYSRYTDLQAETLIESSDIAWGATLENLACLAFYQENHKEPYTITTFYDHVRHQYQFIFLLLLHQKYYYYYLLNEIGSAEEDKTVALQEHQKKLEYFNAKFSFSHVTEVTQYQHVYELGAKAMGLEQLRGEVREPLEQLATREKNDLASLFAKIGIVLALPGIFQVLIDSLSDFLVDVKQYGAIALVVVIAILLTWAFVPFFRRRR